MSEAIYNAADKLAAKLRDFPWYHRTSCVKGSAVISHICVWVNFPNSHQPEEIPKEWMGYYVRVNRVSKEYPCPFGSVKPTDDPQEAS